MAVDESDGYATRREATVRVPEVSIEPSPSLVTRHEDTLQTRQENPGSADSDPLTTRREDTTSAGSGATDEPGFTIGLPAALRARYEVMQELPNPGTEADVLLVRDLQQTVGDDRRVIKLYRQGMKAEQSVWAKVRLMSSPHVVRILDTGTAAGRDYEVMEFLPGGNLTALLPGSGVGLTTAQVSDVVRQVAAALIELHGQNIVHRDLKPENVLIRTAAPLELVVTDFGLSRVTEQSRVAASRSGTVAYWAPEIRLNTGAVTSKAQDWWALGMMARELLTGVRPFEEMTAAGIDQAVMIRGIDLGNVDDPRMLLLCRGLLQRDLDDRWGAQEVQEWLAGGSPAGADYGSASPDGLKPFTFENRRYENKMALARAFAKSWEKAARRYFVGMGTATEASQAWLELRTWLTQFNNPDADDVESLVELIDDQLKPPDIPPDVKLLSLLRWLDPTLPPLYRGQSVTAEHLATIAAQAISGTGSDHAIAVRVVEDLFAHTLLPVLARMRGGDSLLDVDRSWRELESRFAERERDALQRAAIPDDAQALLLDQDRGWRLASLLLLALDPGARPGELADETKRKIDALPARLSWVDRLWQKAVQSRDPVDDVLLLAVFPAAAREAAALDAERRQTQEAERARREVWDSREQVRLSNATAAANQTWGYVGLTLVVMVVLFAIGLGRGAGMNILALAVGVAAGGYIAWSEMEFARQLGSDYGDFTAAGAAGTQIRRLGQRIRGLGWLGGLLLLFVGITAIGLSIQAAFVVYALLAGAHAYHLNNRKTAWQARHEEERRQALDPS